MEKFSAKNITDALWPEAAGIGAICVAELVGSVIDASQGYKYPYVQWGVTAAGFGGGLYLAGRKVGFGTGVMYGATAIAFANLARYLYERTTAEAIGAAPMKVGDVFALVPKKRVVGMKVASAGGTRFQVTGRSPVLVEGTPVGEPIRVTNTYRVTP